MNFFELYQLPVSFSPDQLLVKQQFYALSKKFHPDFYINESEEEQQRVLNLATENNKAYQVLSDPQRTLQYMLQIHDLLPEGESYSLPQDFLMSMMEINEGIMELEFEPNSESLTDIKNKVSAIGQSLTNELSGLTAGYDGLEQSDQRKRLLAIKDVYYRNKYLHRIYENLQKLES